MKTQYPKVLMAMTAALSVSAAGIPFAPTVLAASGQHIHFCSATTRVNYSHTGQMSSHHTNGKSTPLLVSLGDSITFGYNLQDTKGNTVPSHFAYPMLIAKDDHLRVQDLAVPGWTSADLLRALSKQNFVRAVQSANVISIDIGSNDLLDLAGPLLASLPQGNGNIASLNLTYTQYNAFTDAAQAFSGNIKQIVQAVRKLTDAPILLYNVYNPFPPFTAFNELTSIFEAQENSAIEKTAQSFPNVVLVDAQSVFAGHQFEYVRTLENDVHPTVLGQYTLAQLGESALLPYLGGIFGKKK